MNPGISWLILGALAGLIVYVLKELTDGPRDRVTTAVSATEWDSRVAQAIAVAERDAQIARINQLVEDMWAEVEAEQFAENLTDTALHQWIGDNK